MINWLKRLIYGTSKVAEVPESVGRPEVENKVRKAKQPNRRKVSAGKGDKSAKPAGVRSNNKSKASGKSTGKTVRATASKSKTKSKTVQKD